MNKVDERLNTLLAEWEDNNIKPSALAETCSLPMDIAAALVTGRPELLKLTQPRALTADECKRLYHFIGVLIQTNNNLQRHAAQVAILVDTWGQAFKGMTHAAERIENFANFHAIGHQEDNDDA